MCGRRSWRFAPAFLAALFFLSAGTSWAGEESNESIPPPGSSGPAATRSESGTPIDSWETYDEASESFAAALKQLSESWETFAPLLERLGISFEDFPAYIDALIKQSESLDKAIQEERRVAEERARADDLAISLWRGGFSLAAGLGVGAIADGPRGALYGAAGGILSAGIYELGHRILKFW